MLAITKRPGLNLPREWLHRYDLAIEANGVSSTNVYVQAVTLNGAPLSKPSLSHADLKAGGSLVFTMGPALPAIVLLRNGAAMVLLRTEANLPG